MFILASIVIDKSGSSGPPCPLRNSCHRRYPFGLRHGDEIPAIKPQLSLSRSDDSQRRSDAVSRYLHARKDGSRNSSTHMRTVEITPWSCNDRITLVSPRRNTVCSSNERLWTPARIDVTPTVASVRFSSTRCREREDQRSAVFRGSLFTDESFVFKRHNGITRSGCRHPQGIRHIIQPHGLTAPFFQQNENLPLSRRQFAGLCRLPMLGSATLRPLWSIRQ